MKRERRYHRFDPVTVRAATRILQLSQLGHLGKQEVSFYLYELARMEPRAGSGADARLRRLARRRVAFGHTGTRSAMRRHRRTLDTLRVMDAGVGCP